MASGKAGVSTGLVTIGVDPGLSGAIALLGPAGEFERVDDLPIIRDRTLAWVDGGRMQSLLIEALKGRAARAYVERVSAMPAQGVVSCFTFGSLAGSLLAILQAAHVGIELVPPSVWKRDLCLVNQDKRASLDAARLRFPLAPLERAKDHGRAEALLLAAWGFTRAGRGMAA